MKLSILNACKRTRASNKRLSPTAAEILLQAGNKEEKQRMVDYREISVVVQGPIIRQQLENGSFITQAVCQSIRKKLPGAEIIISTWEGEDVSNLVFDKLVYNKSITANRIYMPFSNIDKLNTVNHQIITTFEGIKKAAGKYILKLRSDTALTGTGFIEYYDKYNEYPKENMYKEWIVFSHRLVSLPTYNVNKKYGLPYNICDWVFFGLADDVYDYFDVPLVDTFHMNIRSGEKYPRVEDNFGAEQVLWLECLKKHRHVEIENAADRTDKTKKEFEISLVNNFITISAGVFGIKNLKYGTGGYAAEPYLSHGFYTLSQWERLYNRYGGGTVRIPFRFRDVIVYPVYQFKDYLIEHSTILNRIYSGIVGAVRKTGRRH